MKSKDSAKFQALREFGFMALCLVLVLGYLFRQSIQSAYSTFNNDTPLGVMVSNWEHNRPFLKGLWYDLNWLGNGGVSGTPNVTLFFLSLVGPLFFSKFYAPFTLLFVGLCFWFCLRQWKFSPAVCFVGGLAAALHGDFFPNSCWGVGSQVIGFGLNFLALGLVSDDRPRTRWASVLLAGFAVGLGVTEAYDIGALFSLGVAAFVVWQSLAHASSAAKNITTGGLRLALVAGCAALIAAGIVTSLIGTQIKGVANMAQDEASKARRWEDATMWSTPPAETIGVLVPAVFGLGMNTPNNGEEYWGRGGRVEAWDRYLTEGPLQPGDIVRVQAPGSAQLGQPRQVQVSADGKLSLPGAEAVTVAGLSHKQAEEVVKSALTKSGATSVAFQVELPRGFIKYGGSGGYASAIVLVLVAWAVVQSLRRKDSVFSQFERRMVWFWFAVAVISLLLSYGRFAPFYQLFYSLPYASTIRIPGKFGHLFAWATLILFAYGAQGLWLRYIASAPATTRGLLDQWRVWWSKVGTFERRWVVGGALVFTLAVAGWALYAINRGHVEAYIAKLNFYESITKGGQPDAESAATAARAQMNFSLRQAAKAVFFLGASLGAVAICLTGYFGGARWKFAACLFTVLILGELVPANAPVVKTYNWKEKYLTAANNGVIEFLRQKPHENRVAILSGTLPVNLGLLEGVYRGNWQQHLFQYYNIQTIDIVQMPRPPIEVQMWESALFFNRTPETVHLTWRRWQLMNTRYLLGVAGMANDLNQQLKPNAPFRELMRFDFYASHEPDVILTTTNGGKLQYALIEYTGALPRVKLYAHWQVSTNDEATLQTLRASDFDPAATVLVTEPIAAPAGTNANTGTVEFVSYEPKHISLKAKATAPSVLLLNDKYDASWRVYVDGQSAPLLHCNYVMRGVQVPAGNHTVEFSYEPPLRMLCVSLAATAMLVALLGYVIFVRWRTAA